MESNPIIFENNKLILSRPLEASDFGFVSILQDNNVLDYFFNDAPTGWLYETKNNKCCAEFKIRFLYYKLVQEELKKINPMLAMYIPKLAQVFTAEIFEHISLRCNSQEEREQREAEAKELLEQRTSEIEKTVFENAIKKINSILEEIQRTMEAL